MKKIILSFIILFTCVAVSEAAFGVGFGKPTRAPSGTTLPSSCTVGDMFWDTDEDTTGALFVCEGSNTYKAASPGSGPGGSNTEVQFNDSSVFGGDSNFTWVKANDTLTLGGTLSKIVPKPSSDTTITAAGGITITNVIQRVVGDGGAIDITADPQIVLCASADDGQLVIVQGTSDTNTVKLDDGTGLALCGGTSMTLGKNDNISIMCDFGESEWLEAGGRCDLN